MNWNKIMYADVVVTPRAPYQWPIKIMKNYDYNNWFRLQKWSTYRIDTFTCLSGLWIHIYTWYISNSYVEGKIVALIWILPTSQFQLGFLSLYRSSLFYVLDFNELQRILSDLYLPGFWIQSILNAWELCGNKCGNEANMIDEKLWLV